MTPAELVTTFRSEVEDTATPQLWSDADVYRYLNLALRQLARDADYFYDTDTWASVSVVATDAQIPTTSIPSGETTVPVTADVTRILRIERARLASSQRDLDILTMDQASRSLTQPTDYFYATSHAWETSTGTPRALITDYYDDGRYRLGPIPTVDDIVQLWVYRQPMFELSATDTTANPQWKQSYAHGATAGIGGVTDYEHQLMLLDWMKHEAYKKQDADTYDQKLSEDAKGVFKEKVMEIRRELKRKRRPAGTVAYGGL